MSQKKQKIVVERIRDEYRVIPITDANGAISMGEAKAFKSIGQAPKDTLLGFIEQQFK